MYVHRSTYYRDITTDVSNSNELIMLDDFDPSPKVEWNFVADSVMGGVSSGEVLLGNDGSETFASMIGNVSTENNGGFIQFRSNLDERLDKEVKGVYLKVKGNGEKYYIHLANTNDASMAILSKRIFNSKWLG